MLLLALFVSFNVICQPVLNSLPTATATIYLDFNGHDVNNAYWNGGVPFTCATSGLNDTQITEIFNRVSEDYRPFNINITTELSKFLAAPLSTRIRIVITPTSSWFNGVGGVAFTGSFKWGDDTPAFVFCDRLGPNSPKMVAECCSHESGHTVGLSHQSKYDGTCNLTATYNDGAGTGVNAWAPIMGNSYYRNMSGWNNGPTPYGCTNMQDNLSIITSQNGFSFRPDDFSNDININPATLPLTGTNVDGIITTNTDKDAFTFDLATNSILHIEVKPFSAVANYLGANLDVKLSLYNASKVLLRTYDPAAMMNVEIDTVLTTGSYYMLIDGAGNSNVGDYGSLGSYSVTASKGVILPIHNILLTGRLDQNKHHLKWSIIADEPIKNIEVQSSEDGVHFTSLNTVNNAATSLSYAPYKTTDLFYRIKVTSILNQSAFSNTIQLKAALAQTTKFKVSTFINNKMTIRAPENYQYLVSNIGGNLIAKGNGQAGFNEVDMSRYPGGIYVLQLLNNNEKQTERIIKQ